MVPVVKLFLKVKVTFSANCMSSLNSLYIEVTYQVASYIATYLYKVLHNNFNDMNACMGCAIQSNEVWNISDY